MTAQTIVGEIRRRDALALMASVTMATSAMTSCLAFGAPAKEMRGILPVVTTPYTDSGEIDWEDLAREMVFYDRCGAQGAVWPQGTSDVNLMSKDERMHGMEILANACRPLKIMSILGVQAATTPEMLEYAKRAEAVGADAMIAMPPSGEQTMEGYHAYYAALAGVTKKPVMIQTSIPGVANALVPSLDLLFQLAREYPNLGYIKEECPPLIERMRAELAQAPLIKGVYGASAGEPWLNQMRAGETGESTAQGMYPDVMVRIWQLYQSGRKAEAADGYAKILLMKNCEAQIPGTERYIFKKRGVFKSTAARRGAKKGEKVTIPSFTQDEIDEIEFRFTTLKPYLAKGV